MAQDMYFENDFGQGSIYLGCDSAGIVSSLKNKPLVGLKHSSYNVVEMECDSKILRCTLLRYFTLSV